MQYQPLPNIAFLGQNTPSGLNVSSPGEKLNDSAIKVAQCFDEDIG
jgi:hypothetical protein